MAYTETSTYGYITGDQLEDFTSVDYSVVDATAFAEAKVMGKVSIAETMVHAFLGVSSAQTATDGIKTAVMLISARILNDSMIKFGYLTAENEEQPFNVYIDSIMEKWLTGDTDLMVDSIPMSGASYYRPDSQMFL